MRFSTMNLYQQQHSNLNKKHRCLFCESSEHSPSQCRNVTNVKARVAVLRRKAWCFVCLQSNHVARKCPSEYKCNKCQNRHHISICNQSIQKTANTHSSSDQKSILLQTGRVYVFHSEEPGGLCLVRVLFDGGSQRSYVTE